MNNWYCYILKNDSGKSYNGSTNNMIRRLRQHNGELKGGAKFTRMHKKSDWKVYFLMTGFCDHSNCLQAEWKIKYPNNIRPRPNIYNGYEGRIKGVNEVLKLNRWTRNSIVDNSSMKFDIWIMAEYAHLIHDYPSNVAVHVVDVISNELLKSIEKNEI